MGNIEVTDLCCLRTYSVLAVTSDSLSAAEISKKLAIDPTRAEIKGDLHKEIIEIKKHKFYLSTEGKVSSNDTNDHLDWLVDKLKPRADQIAELQKLGCSIRVGCYWWAQGTAGGPIVGPVQMRGLGDLDIPVGWLVWFKKD